MLIRTRKKREHKNPWGQINIANMSAINALKDVNPKYAEHMFARNHLVEIFAKERFGGVEVLDLPMCRKCEKPGTWHDNDSCYCFACGTVTPKEQTKPLRDWLAQDIKEYGLSTEELKLVDSISTIAFEGGLADMFKELETMEPNNYIPVEGESEALDETDTDTV